jgi:hypothetical protein
VELLSPCPRGPGAGGGFDGDGVADEPVVVPGLLFDAVVSVPLIEKSIPTTTNMAIAAIAPIMPQLLRWGALVVRGFIDPRAVLSLLTGPPGLNSVAMYSSLWFPRKQRKLES